MKRDAADPTKALPFIAGYARPMGEDKVGALALPDDVKHWSRATLREKLIKIGTKAVAGDSRGVPCHLPEVSTALEGGQLYNR